MHGVATSAPSTSAHATGLVSRRAPHPRPPSHRCRPGRRRPTSPGSRHARCSRRSGWVGMAATSGVDGADLPRTHEPAVTAAGVTRHLGQARSVASWVATSPQVALVKRQEAKNGWLNEVGRKREESVIKVAQSSKLQAAMADRLWTVHDVSATPLDCASSRPSRSRRPRGGTF